MLQDIGSFVLTILLATAMYTAVNTLIVLTVVGQST